MPMFLKHWWQPCAECANWFFVLRRNLLTEQKFSEFAAFVVLEPEMICQQRRSQADSEAVHCREQTNSETADTA